VTHKPVANLEQRIADLKKQLEELEKKTLPKFKKGGHFAFVDHEDAAAEKRHIQYLVLLAQIDNLKEAIKELEEMKISNVKSQSSNPNLKSQIRKRFKI